MVASFQRVLQTSFYTTNQTTRKKTEALIERIFDEEPSSVKEHYAEEAMPISKPIFSIGIKDAFVPKDQKERFRRDMALALLDDVIFSRAGEFYHTLFEEGLITPNFGSG